MTDLPAGWTWLQNSRKWHYFNHERKSLCGKFMVFVLPDLDPDPNLNSPDNCAECNRRLEKLIAKTGGDVEHG